MLDQFCLKPKTSEANCLIISYNGLNELHKKKPEHRLFELVDIVVCDEGHRLKNLKSVTAKAVERIETERKILLTGTPIQNNLHECR